MDFDCVCIASGTVKILCKGSKYSTIVGTAGQRVNPSKKTKFVWKPAQGKSISMKYTNWYKGMPDFAAKKAGPESCLTIWPDQGYKWNDAHCKARPCSLCEYYG